MRKRFVTILVAALVVASGFGVSPASAQSANGESITLSPTSTKTTADAGKTIEGKVTIVNDGTQTYEFLLYARPYSIINNDYTNPNFTNVTARTDVYKWISFPQTRYRIEAGATVTANYTMRVPKDAAPGGHYGVIFAETQPDESKASGNMILRKKRVGSILYVTVNGEYKLSGKDAGASISPWQPTPPLRATISATNDGNTDFTTATRLVVKDIFGTTKYDVKKDYQVLPDTTRTMTLEWQKASWFGFYKVEAYQSFLKETVKHEGYVLIVPRFIPLLLVIMLLTGGLYALLRRRKK